MTSRELAIVITKLVRIGTQLQALDAQRQYSNMVLVEPGGLTRVGKQLVEIANQLLDLTGDTEVKVDD